MALPTMRPGLTSREFLRIAGGYNSPALGKSPAGGLDIDNAGNLATDGDVTVDGAVDVQGGEVKNTTGDLTLDAQNSSADSTIYLKNSDATYEANVDVEGDLDVGGNLSVGQFLSLGNQVNLTISSGAITPTNSFATLSSEGGASTDDLDNINGGVTGDILILTTTGSAETITVKGAAGNVLLNSSGDFVMAGTWDTLGLIKRGTKWVELFRMDR